LIFQNGHTAGYVYYMTDENCCVMWSYKNTDVHVRVYIVLQC